MSAGRQILGESRFSHSPPWTWRRAFISLLGGAAAWPLAARAQQAYAAYRRVVVYIRNRSGRTNASCCAPTRSTGTRLGWTEGLNIKIDYRWSAGDPGRARAYAAELVALNPEVIFAAPSSVQRATRTIPVVFAQVADPVGASTPVRPRFGSATKTSSTRFATRSSRRTGSRTSGADRAKELDVEKG